MNNCVIIDLFVEDKAHEEFVRALIQRIATQEGKEVNIRIASATGGHGKALAELDVYQTSRRILSSAIDGLPDILVIAIDANCSKYSNMKNQILAHLSIPFKDIAILAIPDPHIEKWYLADSEAIHSVAGIRPSLGKRKCIRNYYKEKLSNIFIDAGHPLTLGGIEFAPEIVDHIDLFRAGKNEKSFKIFVDCLTSALRRFQPGSPQLVMEVIP